MAASEVGKVDIDVIREAIHAHPEVEALIQLDVVLRGTDGMLVGARVAFAPDDRLSELARVIDEVADAIRAALPSVRSVYIEPDVYRRPSEANPPTDVFVIRGTD